MTSREQQLKPYRAPELRHYGAITQLVQGQGGSGVDGSSGQGGNGIGIGVDIGVDLGL